MSQNCALKNDDVDTFYVHFAMIEKRMEEGGRKASVMVIQCEKDPSCCHWL